MVGSQKGRLAGYSGTEYRGCLSFELEAGIVANFVCWEWSCRS